MIDMNTRKFVSTVTAASLLALSLSGCSLLGGKDKEAVEEVTTQYINYIRDAKYSKSSKLVVDGEDFFVENELPEQQAELVGAVLAASEFEFEDIEVKKDSATASVVFTMPDLDSIADEGYSFDEFIDAIEDIDDTVEEEFRFELSKDGEDWLIEGDSTADFYDFLMNIGEGIEFSGLSEQTALEMVDTLYTLLGEGDIPGVIALCNDTDDIFEEYEDIIEGMPDEEWLGRLFSSYFSNIEYESEVTAVEENQITVAVTGTAPDAEASVTAAVNNPDIMVPIMADYIETYVNGNPDQDAVVNAVLNLAADVIGDGDPIPYNATIYVSVDEEGNYSITGDDILFDFDFPDIMDGGDLIEPALQLLLEQGRITQDQLVEFMGGEALYDTDVPQFGVSMDYGNTGDDFYSFHFTDGNGDWFTDDVYPSNRGAIDFYVITWDYYEVGTLAYCEVFYDGEVIDSITASNSSSGTDTFEFTYEPSRLEDGDYIFRIYDITGNGVLVDAYCTVEEVN